VIEKKHSTQASTTHPQRPEFEKTQKIIIFQNMLKIFVRVALGASKNTSYINQTTSIKHLTHFDKNKF
jgi:hypothetical protein